METLMEAMAAAIKTGPDTIHLAAAEYARYKAIGAAGYSIMAAISVYCAVFCLRRNSMAGTSDGRLGWGLGSALSAFISFWMIFGAGSSLTDALAPLGAIVSALISK